MMDSRLLRLQRWSIFLYGIFSYMVGLAGQLWFILYLGEWEFMERTVYSAQTLPVWAAVIINTGLVLLFGIQHTVMARQWFKDHLIRYLPQSAERSTYVLLSGMALIVVVLFWQPIDGTVWKVDAEPWHTLLIIGYLLGWLFSVVASFVINHFELFGLQQVYFNLKSREMPDIAFQEKLFYTFVRHPIQLGVLIGIWITPVMTYGHLLFSVLFTIYIFIGLYYEEIDMQEHFGVLYRDYKKRVGMLFPKSFKSKKCIK